MDPYIRQIDLITDEMTFSFGFGGANAHAILESYVPPAESYDTLQAQGLGEPTTLPFIFSAACESSLRANLRSSQIFLQNQGKDLDLSSFAHTLNSHRSRLPVVTRITAASSDELATKIGLACNTASLEHFEYLGARGSSLTELSPRILAVFTGQGAQWPRMGAELILRSPLARESLERLQHRLNSLPETDRPAWSLRDELLQDASSSRISSAVIAQPLCTAIQIILVDILRSARVNLTAAVGHSSGEIAAAYASGAISSDDAICIAYYRGLYGHLAQGSQGQEGAMLAVGTSLDDAEDLLREPEFHGRAVVAAVNSATSITLSGDAKIIDHIAIVFKDEKKFARRLKVDKAYHSHHMLSCSPRYCRALEAMDIQPQNPSRCSWFSSVFDNNDFDIQSLGGPYWDWNMVRSVQFSQAISNACETCGPFDLALEIGPHPALKGPTLETLDTFNQSIPYMGLLHRGSSALETLSDCLGYISGCFGSESVDFHGFHSSLYGKNSFQLLRNLPTYQWNHEKEYWHESRFARAIRGRAVVHELLGHLTPDSSKQDMRWRHLLRPSEIPWMRGHRLQGQIVFPAAAYIVSAFEASSILLESTSAKTIEVLDFEIGHALTFDEDSTVEIVFCLTTIKRLATHITANFGYHAAVADGQEPLSQIASGSIRIELGEPSPSALPIRSERPRNLFRVDTEEFYRFLERHEYQYTGHFSALSGLQRKLGAATGFIENVQGSKFLLHPAVLDVSFQSVFLAASTPGDGELWSLHVPTRIKRVIINPTLFNSESGKGSLLPFDTFQPKIPSFSGDVDVFPPHGHNAMLQVEGLECVPFSPATANDDKTLFSTVIWKPAVPEALSLVTEDNHDWRSVFQHFIDQITHRTPHIHCLELSAGNGPSFASTAGAIAHLFSSYTFTNASAGSFPEIQTAFKSHASQAALKTSVLEINQEPSRQGFQRSAYELVVAHLTLDVPDIEAVLVNVRYLLKPGGYLVTAVLPDQSPAGIGLSLGAFQAWSAASGSIDSHPQRPELLQWDELFKKTGFSGCDCVAGGHDAAVGALPIFLSQAVDEKISFLRDPLGGRFPSFESTPLIEDFIIIGGGNPKTQVLAVTLGDLLRPLYCGIRQYYRFQDLEPGSVSSTSTILVMVDLESAVFNGLDESTWEALKLLFMHAGTIVWLTAGRFNSQPLANMTVGLLRSAIHEVPGLSLQFIDVEDEPLLSVENIAEALVQFKAATLWRNDGSDEYHTMPIEQEISMKKGGAIFVPRLIAEPDMNDRYNSNRRRIARLANLNRTDVQLVNNHGGYHVQLDYRAQKSYESRSPIFHVTHTLLAPTRFTSRFHLFVSLGRLKDSPNKQYIALSTTQASVIYPDVVIPIDCELPMGSEAEFLHLVGLHHLALEVLQNLDGGDRILAHEPGLLLGKVLQSKARDQGIDLTVTTSSENYREQIYVHPNASDRSLVELDLPTVSLLLDLSDVGARSAALAQRMRGQTSTLCRVETRDKLFGGIPKSTSAARLDRACENLLDAMKQASQDVSTLEQCSLPTQTQEIRIGDDISKLKHLCAPFLVINWNREAEVMASIQPVDTGLRFSKHKTYWLAGLTGSLGVSLCQWMVDHGARYVVMSSRQPKIDLLWLEQMHKVGATIRVLAWLVHLTWIAVVRQDGEFC